MREYEIRRLIRRARGSKLILPGIEESAGGKASYLRALRKLLRQLASRARSARTQYDLDQLIAFILNPTEAAEQTVENILRLEAKRHTDTFMAAAKRALGVDLSAVVREDDLGDYLRLAAARNTSMIKNLSDDAVKRVQQVVLDGLIAGTPRAEVQKSLTKQLGISDNRAKLIAQDQMAKLNSDLNRIRHEQAGVKEYVWTTAHDERVRPLHRALDGKQYRYGEPTGAEGGLQPGQPVRCRCIARAVVEF